MLLGHEADVSAADKEGRTAVHLAAEAGNPLCVMAILQDSRSVSILSLPTAQGNTPLHDCLRRGDRMTESVTELVRRDADVSLCNTAGESPLILAVQNKWNMDIMKLLILGDRQGHNNDGVFMNHLEHVGCRDSNLNLSNVLETHSFTGTGNQNLLKENHVRPLLQAVTDEQVKRELPLVLTYHSMVLSVVQHAARKTAFGITGRRDGGSYYDLLTILERLERENIGRPDPYYDNVAALLIGWGAVDPMLTNLLWYEMNRRQPASCLFEALVNSFAVLPSLTELVRYFPVSPPSAVTRSRPPQQLHDEQTLIQNGLGSTPEVSEKYRRYIQVRSEIPTLKHQSRIAIRSYFQAHVGRGVKADTRPPELVKTYILLGHQLS